MAASVRFERGRCGRSPLPVARMTLRRACRLLVSRLPPSRKERVSLASDRQPPRRAGPLGQPGILTPLRKACLEPPGRYPADFRLLERKSYLNYSNNKDSCLIDFMDAMNWSNTSTGITSKIIPELRIPLGESLMPPPAKPFRHSLCHVGEPRPSAPRVPFHPPQA